MYEYMVLVDSPTRACVAYCWTLANKYETYWQTRLCFPFFFPRILYVPVLLFAHLIQWYYNVVFIETNAEIHSSTRTQHND